MLVKDHQTLSIGSAKPQASKNYTRQFVPHDYWRPLCQMDVSENSGFSPQIIHFNRVFHYKQSFWGTTIFGNTQIS